MNPLQTDNIIALSLLLDEDIYVLNDLLETEVIKQITVEAPTVIEPVKVQETPVLSIPKIEAQVPVIPSKTDSFDYLGENNKYILVIVDNETEKFLNKVDLAFLLKIMGAKKWVLEDVAIINKAKYNNLNFEDLQAYFACSKIITFGFNPAVLNIVGAVANQKTVYKNVAVLGTWDLAKLQSDVPKKTIFWNQLKAF